jgi:hypothetical protein
MKLALLLLAACGGGGSFAATGGAGVSDRVALKGDSLYFPSTIGRMFRAPREAGNGLELSATPWQRPELVASSTHVYWSTQLGTLAQVEIGGVEREHAITADALAVDDDRLVFGDSVGIFSVELPGFAERPLLLGRQASSLALDDDHAYGSSCLTDDDGIWSIELATGSFRKLSDGCSDSVTIDDHYIYANQVIDNAFLLTRTAKTGGTTELLFGGNSEVFAVRDGFVYVSLGFGEIHKIPSYGGAGEVIANVGFAPGAIAVDDETLYVLSIDAAGTVMRFPLP